MPDCLFCKIVAKEIPADFIAENEDAYAFADLHPNNLGHTLVVPKEHFQNIYTVPEKNLASLMSLVKKVAQGVKTGVAADGINIHINNEPAAGQVIFHFHVHVIPRYMNDGLSMWKGIPRPPEQISETAEKIRQAIKSVKSE